MKIGFNLKLGLGIVLVFGLLILGMILYEPVWYKIQVGRLASDNPSVRESTAKKIAAEGEKAMPYLKRWLNSESGKGVTAACLVLEKMDADMWQQCLPDILKILRGPTSEITDTASALVYDLGYACDENLSWRNFWDEPTVRRNICIYILKSGKNETLRATAASLLGRIGDGRAVTFLLKALSSDGDPDVRKCAARALGAIGRNCPVKPLILALDRDPKVRGCVVDILGKIDDPRVVEPLIKVVRNEPDWQLRRSAAEALGEIRDKRAVEPLCAALSADNNSNVRDAAAEALGRIGDPEAMAPLVKALRNNPDSWSKKCAARALGKIADDRAVALLVEALRNDTDFDVRNYSAQVLGLIGNSGAVDVLLGVLAGDSDPTVRRSAADSLAMIGDNRATITLISALENDSDLRVRSGAARALGMMRDIRAIPALIRAVEDVSNFDASSSDVQGTAALALGRIGDLRAVEPLVIALTCGSYYRLRQYAAGALGWLDDEDSVKALARALRTDREVVVRMTACDALGEIGRESVVEPLIAALGNDTNVKVRLHAAIALADIEGEEVDYALKVCWDSEKNPGAGVALLWRGKARNFDAPSAADVSDFYLPFFHNYALARWGNVKAVEGIISRIDQTFHYLVRFNMEVFSRMPQDFPGFDFSATGAVRRKQIKEMRAWYEKSKDRFAWNREKERYYLKDK
ncbi:MAG: hypothetical protein E3J72_00360 [Planctomycetota bacterium]|nr:MAG: hypothetical protein E3J72_00360 [Planctomycetota bacterium]